MTWTVYARNASLQRVAAIDDYKELKASIRHADVGTWLLDMDVGAAGAAELQQDGAGIVVVADGRTVLSGPKRSPAREWGGDANRLKVAGFTDDAWLARRLAHPQPSTAAPPYNSQAYDVRTGIASTTLRQYVDVNAGPSAIGARRVPGLTLAGDPALGTTVTGRARWQPLLELLQELALAGGGLGFRVRQSGSGIQFEVYQPADRTASVVFSPALGNLLAFSWSEEAPGSDYVYVGGGGEGTARTILEVSDSDAVARWGRVESFRDRRDTTDTAELTQAGTDELEQSAGPVQLSITPRDLSQMAYGVHYDLGDRVTVIVDGAPVQELIRQIDITLSERDGALVVPTIGTPGRRELLALFGRMRALARRLNTLERR